MTINCSEKIGEIGLDRLIDTYLCSKYGKDPTKCIDCPSLDGCPAGKRAVELLEEETASKPKIKYGTDEGRKKAGKIMADRARKNAEEASKVSNAVEFLMNKFGVSRVAATNRVSIYKKKYPDLTFGTMKHPKKPEPIEDADTDEVSLDDFLKLNGDTDGDHICMQHADYIQQAEDQLNDKLKSKGYFTMDDIRNSLYSEDSNFVTSLKAEYDRTQQRITDISTKIADLEKEQEYLEMVLESMGDLMELMESRKNDNSYNEKDGV